MIKNSAGKLYIGITEDPNKRLATHNSKRGANFTSTSLSTGTPFKIVFLEEYPDLQSSRQREIQIKKWSRVKKEILIEAYNNKTPTKNP